MPLYIKPSLGKRLTIPRTAYSNLYGILKFSVVTNPRKVRKAKNMSMEKLAEEAGLEYSQISRIELGQINTKITTVRAIAKGLKIPEMDLFDFKIS